ncbi:shikimate dehydrogenase family protein [Dokdonia sinensis]|nr:shikimate dehydrogenase [Dokdonia sinensis]
MDKYGLFGKNIGYSFSRNYFRAKFTALERNATYENFDCATIQEVQNKLKDATVSGYNVTIPYKEAIIPLLDTLDKHSAAIGAVNTIKRMPNGELKGFNTDFIGFGNSLLEQYGETLFGGADDISAFAKGDTELVSNTEKKSAHKEEQNALALPINALIMGTGGASKAVVYAFELLGVSCQYISRKRTKTTISYEDLTEEIIGNATFIVNCTPLGTYPEVELHPDIPYDFLNITHIAYDLIYNPPETTFLAKAKAQDADVLNGLRMLELQAQAAWDIWNSTS